MIVYIKFKHQNDILAINPFYDLRPRGDDFIPPRICGRCSDTLYIPVEMPEDATITIPRGEIYKPLPKEYPSLGIRGEPDLPSLTVIKSLDYSEQQRLRQYRNMHFVDDRGFEMTIVGISEDPVKHVCEDLVNETLDKT
jgi:hypothetical protein